MQYIINWIDKSGQKGASIPMDQTTAIKWLKIYKASGDGKQYWLECTNDA